MIQRRWTAVVLTLVMAVNLSACAAKQGQQTGTAVSGTASISDLNTIVTEANRDDYDYVWNTPSKN